MVIVVALVEVDDDPSVAAEVRATLMRRLEHPVEPENELPQLTNLHRHLAILPDQPPTNTGASSCLSET